MKRLAIILSIIILTVILSPCIHIFAQPTHTPHENPLTAEDTTDSASLLRFYGNVFELATLSQYQDAQSMLNELEYANIPDEIKYLIDRYNTISGELFTTLENLESLLGEISTLLSSYQVNEAREKLDVAEATVRNARLLLDDIETATTTFADKLGVLTPSATSQVTEAYSRLEDILLRLRGLIDKLNKLLESLTNEYEVQAQGELIDTELSLDVTPESVFIGETITASGKLIANNHPLCNRELTLLLSDEALAVTTTTDSDGYYTANLVIPYRYIPMMTLRAEYIPSGDDIGIYLACQSMPVVVNTSYYTTLLEVSAPEIAHPGFPIKVNGQISSTGNDVERIAKVFLDDAQLAEEKIEGKFNVELTPPERISTGGHSLRIMVEPQKRYSGISKNLNIHISRIPVQADIRIPLFIITPGTVRISGQVYHSLGPLQDATVNFNFKESSATVKTSADGSFIGTVETPIDLSMVGPQELTLTVEPAEPWYDSLLIKRWVFTITPTNIGLILAAFISLGLLAYHRGRTGPSIQQEESVEDKPYEIFPVTSLSRPRYKFTGIKGRLLLAYLDGLKAVEKAVGISMAPHTTLREFLNTATPLLPVIIKPFNELTTMAEIALYSIHEPDEDTALRAEQLVTIIKKELRNGTA